MMFWLFGCGIQKFAAGVDAEAVRVVIEGFGQIRWQLDGRHLLPGARVELEQLAVHRAPAEVRRDGGVQHVVDRIELYPGQRQVGVAINGNDLDDLARAIEPDDVRDGRGRVVVAIVPRRDEDIARIDDVGRQAAHRTQPIGATAAEGIRTAGEVLGRADRVVRRTLLDVGVEGGLDRVEAQVAVGIADRDRVDAGRPDRDGLEDGIVAWCRRGRQPMAIR